MKDPRVVRDTCDEEQSRSDRPIVRGTAVEGLVEGTTRRSAQEVLRKNLTPRAQDAANGFRVLVDVIPWKLLSRDQEQMLWKLFTQLDR